VNKRDFFKRKLKTKLLFHLFGHLELLNLAVGVDREALDKLEKLGHLKVGDFAVAVLDQLLFGQIGARFRLDPYADLFAHSLVRHAHAIAVQNVRVIAIERFDLSLKNKQCYSIRIYLTFSFKKPSYWINVNSASDDQLFGSRFKAHMAFVVHCANVTRM
jgi:hypothetical protein